MARRGFNRNQKRDRKGRWASGGGSSSSSGEKPKKSLKKRNSLTVRRSVGYGAVAGGFLTLGAPVGFIAGSAVGGAFAAGRVRRRNKREAG
jgi:hypothetical protein